MKSFIEKWNYSKEFADEGLIGVGEFHNYAELNNLLVEVQEDGSSIELFSIKTGRGYR